VTEGPAQKRAAGSAMARRLQEKPRDRAGGAGARRERSDRRVRRGDRAVGAQPGRA
jgi:hypothetical protein